MVLTRLLFIWILVILIFSTLPAEVSAYPENSYEDVHAQVLNIYEETPPDGRWQTYFNLRILGKNTDTYGNNSIEFLDIITLVLEDDDDRPAGIRKGDLVIVTFTLDDPDSNEGSLLEIRESYSSYLVVFFIFLFPILHVFFYKRAFHRSLSSGWDMKRKDQLNKNFRLIWIPFVIFFLLLEIALKVRIIHAGGLALIGFAIMFFFNLITREKLKKVIPSEM